MCESTRNSTINGRKIHHADLDDHTLHRLLGKSEQSPEHIQKHQSILAGISEEMISSITKKHINFPPNLTDTKKPTSYNYKMDSKYPKFQTLYITLHWHSNTLWILLRSTSIHRSKISPQTHRQSKPMTHRLIASIRIPTISKYTMNHFQVHQNFSKQE